MTPRLWLLTLSSIALVSCGRYYAGGQPARPPANPPPTVMVEGKRTTLTVFGAGFCTKCKAQFPEINQLLSQLSAKERALLDIKLFYVAGEPSNVRPTQELAESYRDNYFPLAQPEPDLPWRWANFKLMLPGVKLDVPAAVVSDENGQILKRFPAGDTTFVSAEISSFVEARLKAQ